MSAGALAFLALPAQQDVPAGYVAILDVPGRPTAFYGHGRTKTRATEAARSQMIGASCWMRTRLMERIELRPIDAAHYSDVEEMLEAEVIEWL